jgi:hypothetical protein
MTDERSVLMRMAEECVRETVGIDKEQVASMLVSRIVGYYIESGCIGDEVANGVAGAIDGFEHDSFRDVLDFVTDRRQREIEAQAKRIALRLLGEMAAQWRRELAVESV